MTAAAPSSVEAFRRRLERELRSAPADLLSLVERSCADEPGRALPRFEEPTCDLVDALVSAPRPSEAADRRCVAEATEVAALLRGLAETGTTPALGVVIRHAPRERGVFTAEVGRDLYRSGERAVPALVQAQGHPAAAVRTFAAEALAWAGRGTPGEQVQLHDPAVLAELLTVYGQTADRSVIPVLLSFTGSEQREVRLAAREATLRYGQAVLWPARIKYENFTGADPPRQWGWQELAERLFAAQDQARLVQAEDEMEAALALARAGQHEKMLTAYTRILARWPLYERRSEMVPGLVAYAGELEKRGDRRRARELLGRAALVETAAGSAAELRARVALGDAEIAFARGIADPTAIEHILTTAGRTADGERLLEAVRRRTERPSPHAYRVVAAIGLAAFAIACLGLLVVRALPPARRDEAQPPSGAPAPAEPVPNDRADAAAPVTPEQDPPLT